MYERAVHNAGSLFSRSNTFVSRLRRRGITLLTSLPQPSLLSPRRLPRRARVPLRSALPRRTFAPRCLGDLQTCCYRITRLPRRACCAARTRRRGLGLGWLFIPPPGDCLLAWFCPTDTVAWFTAYIPLPTIPTLPHTYLVSQQFSRHSIPLLGCRLQAHEHCLISLYQLPHFYNYLSTTFLHSGMGSGQNFLDRTQV